jgi:hypothetical protein
MQQGVMAQLVARLLSMQKVFGSIPNYSSFLALLPNSKIFFAAM